MTHLFVHRPGAGPGLLRPALGPGTLLCLALLFWVPGHALGQQFVVDDAPIVDPRACQLEVWHGRLAGWALPACQFIPSLELTAGVGWVRDFDDGWHLDYVLQGKYLLRDLAPDDFGVGVVAGVGLGPVAQAMGRSFHEAFAYVPLSVSTFEGRLIVHLNAGWSMEREQHGEGAGAHTHTHHHFIWGARADVALTDRFTVIGEVFGEDRLVPEYQVGLRTALIRDRLFLDVSYGDRLRDRTAEDRIGLVLGLAWTPPAVF